MSKIKWKGSAILAPLPAVLVTCGSGDKPNIFTAAWTGIVNTRPPVTCLSIRPERYSHGLIMASGEFAIHLTTEALVRAVDTCGIRSGREEDKFKTCGLATLPASEIAPPILEASPLSLECRVRSVTELGSHDLFLADILCVNVEETLLDDRGKLRLDRARLLAYSHGDYFALGRKLGNFGFTVRKKSPGRRPSGKR